MQAYKKRLTLLSKIVIIRNNDQRKNCIRELIFRKVHQASSILRQFWIWNQFLVTYYKNLDNFYLRKCNSLILDSVGVLLHLLRHSATYRLSTYIILCMNCIQQFRTDKCLIQPASHTSSFLRDLYHKIQEE